MRKVLLGVALVLTTAVGFAQESFAIKGGLNLNDETGKDVKTKHNLGFHIGATYQNDFSNVLALETGLFFDTRGAKIEKELFGQKVTETSTIYGLTLPVLAKAKIEVGTLTVFLNAGPYMNVGLFGKGTLKGNSKEEKLDIKFGDEGVNRFGFGLNFGGGVELNKFVLSVGYDLGLTETAKNNKSYANAIKIGLGYKF